MRAKRLTIILSSTVTYEHQFYFFYHIFINRQYLGDLGSLTSTVITSWVKKESFFFRLDFLRFRIQICRSRRLSLSQG